jgi:undecaprenyl diphosphate synthase
MFFWQLEIVAAAKDIAQRVHDGVLTPDQVTVQVFNRSLNSVAKGIGPPDLVIRTSGEQRLSNFFLFEVAYSEIHFSPVLWPDFTKDHLIEAVNDYKARDRTFGGPRRRGAGASSIPRRSGWGRR